MKFLLDTNIFIPLEPGSASDLEPGTGPAAALLQTVLAGGHQVFVHPEIRTDIGRDKNPSRAELRRQLLEKYPLLPDPPSVSVQLKEAIGHSTPDSNDWVDDHLLAALEADCVDLLVTEDRGVRSKARRLGLLDRVVVVREATEILERLHDDPTDPPPAVQLSRAHVIRNDDPILHSFRESYPGFDEWLSKCKREHRFVWIIPGKDGNLAGFCLFKQETEGDLGLDGKIMKICSFKVSERHNGFRFGELLLKATFEHAFQNDYDWMFVTVFEEHSHLIELMEEFGFSRMTKQTELGEIILAKHLTGQNLPELGPLDFHIRCGPYNFEVNVDWYLVPIQPRFADILFPETTKQTSMFPGNLPFGNSIKKAYLCNSSIRTLKPGDVVAFYRSEDAQGIFAVGVVEHVLVSQDPTEVARAVARRTVYSMQEINNLCEKEVLAILFRQARLLGSPLDSATLTSEKVFSRAPQSIQRVKESGLPWLKRQFPQK